MTVFWIAGVELRADEIDQFMQRFRQERSLSIQERQKNSTRLVLGLGAYPGNGYGMRCWFFVGRNRYPACGHF
ncbi:MAG: hypothetical protein QF752_04980 [Planctomycetota bacterium]|nr:hypothetical protein [Planctomycetota bacterium]